MAKLPKRGEGTAQDDATGDEAAPTRDREAPVPAGSTSGERITVGDREFLVQERRHVRASPKAGIPDAEYPVVIEEGKDGKRTYKAATGGKLYTIKNYGRPDEVIIKLRDGANRPRRAESSSQEEVVSAHFDFEIEDDVVELLAEYKALEPRLDPEAWLNNQLRNVLTQEITRLEKVREGLKKLPQDLLSDLASADPAKLAQIRAMLKD